MARIASFTLPAASGNASIPTPLRRLRTYIIRLPFFTRITLLVIVFFWILELQTVWSVVKWGSLTPSKVSLGSGMYRLNTFPFIHLGFWHMLMDTACLIPLMERFEAECGTLNSLALFLGPFASFPGGLYLLLQRGLWGADEPIVGSSIWIFLLLASESIKLHRTNSHLELLVVRIPTPATPLVILVLTTLLIPYTSFEGHLCGLAIGYLWGLRYIRFLAPPEKALRWVEGKLNLLGRLPGYVSVDQKTYGRYGVLPTTTTGAGSGSGNGVVLGTADGEHGGAPARHNGSIGLGWLGRSLSAIKSRDDGPVVEGEDGVRTADGSSGLGGSGGGGGEGSGDGDLRVQ